MIAATAEDLRRLREDFLFAVLRPCLRVDLRAFVFLDFVLRRVDLRALDL